MIKAFGRNVVLKGLRSHLPARLLCSSNPDDILKGFEIEELQSDRPFKEARKLKIRKLLADKSAGISSEVSLLVLGNGAYGCSKSILLSTEFRQYLFNAGEDVVRAVQDAGYDQKLLSGS